MNRSLNILTALVLGALVASCGEQQQQMPTAATPSFARTNSGPTCSFNAMNSDIAKFFTSSTEAKLVKALQSTMQDAWSASDTAGARDAGYDIFAQIAEVVASASVGDVSSGSDLTNQVTACMFWDSSQLPADFPHDYTTELTPSAAGAFDVRGGPNDSTGPILARTLVSGIDPIPGYSWADEIAAGGSVPAPHRVLFYGEPAAVPGAYEWKPIPANATFSPGLIVGLCDPGDQYMVYSSEGTILPYYPATFIPGTCATASAPTNVWQKSLALGKRLVSKLLPSPLDAASLSLPGSGGVSKSYSTFSNFDVGTVTVSYSVQPHDATVLPSDVCPSGTIGDPYNIGPVTFQVTKDGIPVGGVDIALTQVNNNGTPATLCGNTHGVTDDNGYLTLDGLGLTKTGGYELVASGNVPGRNINSSGGTSDKFNIRP